MVDPKTLILGGEFHNCGYVWKPYHERPKDQQQDYDRLRLNMVEQGIQNPLICYKGHVLVGQRRCEIAIELGMDVPIVEVDDPHPDVVNKVKAQYKPVSY